MKQESQVFSQGVPRPESRSLLGVEGQARHSRSVLLVQGRLVPVQRRGDHHLLAAHRGGCQRRALQFQCVLLIPEVQKLPGRQRKPDEAMSSGPESKGQDRYAGPCGPLAWCRPMLPLPARREVHLPPPCAAGRELKAKQAGCLRAASFQKGKKKVALKWSSYASRGQGFAVFHELLPEPPGTAR